MRRSLFLSFALLVFFSAEARAAGDSAPNAVPTYIDPDFLSPTLLPPPAAEGSAEWRKQIEEVLKAQKSMTPADMAAMKDEQHLRLELMTSVAGDSFTRDRFPKTFALLDHVLVDAARITEADKEFWHTRRPYLTDKRVKLYVDPIDASPGYPSGHTSEMKVLAEVIGMLKPEKLNELRARADVIALHRVEAGVHSPEDVEGGRDLALLMVGALAANDDFQDDILAARKELSGK